mgnify:CR=1 FL=1
MLQVECCNVVGMDGLRLKAWMDTAYDQVVEVPAASSCGNIKHKLVFILFGPKGQCAIHHMM